MAGEKVSDMWLVTEHMTTEEWVRVAAALGGRTGARARRGSSTRRFVNAVLWVAQTRACWSDLPPLFGPWHSVYVRFLRWMRGDQWHAVVEALQEGGPKEELRRMIQLYVDKGIARDMRRKVLAAHASGAQLGMREA
ncbi:transposase [Pseudoxanthomonas putridarboris]|uniref:Transposase n=1 Tax=Pseudoxanthomonas putridarboris TaxID=752605 RepID=A0ABU9IX11_9GAMM